MPIVEPENLRLPDFFIIGAMKSATSSLHDQLAVQSNIYMSEPKEPCFFSDDQQYARGLKWYAHLFAEAPGSSFTGESSTHYSKLPTYPETVARISRSLPAAKFIYIMRHPLDRLISHYIHEWTMGIFKSELDQAIELYPELISYGQYAFQIRPYLETFGRQSVCPVFFDRLVAHPQSELERICRFIGLAEKPVWQPEFARSNISSERVRRFPLYRYIYASKFATWFRRSFIPQSIRDLIKARFTMQQRPELSEHYKSHLEQVFNEDLNVLSEWLGVELNCINFKQVTRDNVLEWKSPNE